MSELGGIVDGERELLAEIAEAAAAARKMSLTARYADLRSEHRAAAPGADFDAEAARRSAIAEVALATSASYPTVSGWIRTTLTLERHNDIRAAFTEGRVGTAQVRTICEHTAATPAAVVRVIEPAVVAAAQRLTPRSLGVEIDRLLLQTDPDAAEHAAERARKARRVTSQRAPRGMGAIRAVLTAAETTEVWQQLRQMVHTVCALDRRDIQQRYADAYLAVLRGHSGMACACDRDECTARRNPLHAAPDIRLHISCDVDTLLGVGGSPAILDGYGCLDAATARTLAKDATWQAIIHTAERLDIAPARTAVDAGLAPADTGAAMAATNPLLAKYGHHKGLEQPPARSGRGHARRHPRVACATDYHQGRDNVCAPSAFGHDEHAEPGGSLDRSARRQRETSSPTASHGAPTTAEAADHDETGAAPTSNGRRAGAAQTASCREAGVASARGCRGVASIANRGEEGAIRAAQSGSASACRAGGRGRPRAVSSSDCAAVSLVGYAGVGVAEAGACVDASEASSRPGVGAARTRRLPAGAVFDKAGLRSSRPSPVLWQQVIDNLHAIADRDPTTILAWDRHGHGGFHHPPPGALTYQPSGALADAVRLRDGTCRHPGCTTPAIDCQIDHIVPFTHRDPAAGGWTVLANLQCLCRLHHGLKTAKLWQYEMLGLGIVHAWNTHGQHGFTLPAHRAARPVGTGAI